MFYETRKTLSHRIWRPSASASAIVHGSVSVCHACALMSTDYTNFCCICMLRGLRYLSPGAWRHVSPRPSCTVPCRIIWKERVYIHQRRTRCLLHCTQTATHQSADEGRPLVKNCAPEPLVQTSAHPVPPQSPTCRVRVPVWGPDCPNASDVMRPPFAKANAQRPSDERASNTRPRRQARTVLRARTWL